MLDGSIVIRFDTDFVHDLTLRQIGLHKYVVGVIKNEKKKLRPVHVCFD